MVQQSSMNLCEHRSSIIASSQAWSSNPRTASIPHITTFKHMILVLDAKAEIKPPAQSHSLFSGTQCWKTPGQPVKAERCETCTK